jgi:hypothetical protein
LAGVNAKSRRLAARFAAGLVGLGLAFFFVLAPLFTDGPESVADPERLASFAISLLVYLAAGVILGFLDPGDLVLAAILAAPGLVLASLYATREPGTLGLAAAYVAVSFVGAWGGVRVAALRRKPPAA